MYVKVKNRIENSTPVITKLIIFILNGRYIPIHLLIFNKFVKGCLRGNFTASCLLLSLSSR